MWTRKSVLVAGTGVASLLLAGVTKSWQLAGFAVAVLAFVVVNFLLYRRGADVVGSRELDLVRVFEGDANEVRVTLENRGKRAVFMEVRDKLPRQVRVESGSHYAFLALKGGEKATLRYELKCPLLGVYAIGPLTLRVEDPFGLFFEERVVGAEDSLSVLPRKEDMRKANLLSKLPMPLLGEHEVNQPGDGFDFFALREYVPGDTLKTVNWKASARTGKLMVNQMQRVTSAEATVIFDGRAVTAAGKEDESPRVVGARAAASIVNWLFGKRDLCRFVLYDDDVHEIEPAPSNQQFPVILETLAGHKPRGAVPLKIAVQDVLPELKVRTPVILISPFVDDPTALEAASTLLANEMVVIVVSPRPPSLPGVESDLATALLRDRQRILDALGGYGCLIVDLEPGAPLGASVERAQVVMR